MKISLIALYFKPDETIGSIRPENWANWLSKEHEVTVITRELKGADDANDNFTVVRPASRLMRFLEWANDFRKNRRLTSQVKSESKWHKEVGGGMVGKPTGIFSYRMPCLYDIWFFACYRALRKTKPELIVATHSPYVAIVAAWFYSLLNPQVKLWVDFRDLWVGNHLAIGISGFRRLEKWLESSILRRADVISTVSEGLAEYFGTMGYANKTFVVHNAPLTSGSSECMIDQGSRGAKVTLCYTGTIYSGWQDPSPLLEMLSRLSSDGVIKSGDCIFNIASRNAGNIFELIKSHGVEGFVEFLGPVSRNKSMSLQKESDVLVMLEVSNARTKGVLTGKVFEYLATDKPILLLGPGEDMELYQLLRKHDRLISLAEFESFLLGKSELKQCLPVDYSLISSERVVSIAHSIC